MTLQLAKKKKLKTLNKETRLTKNRWVFYPTALTIVPFSSKVFAFMQGKGTFQCRTSFTPSILNNGGREGCVARVNEIKKVETQSNRELFISCKESRIESNTNFYSCFYLGPFNPGETITIANTLRRTLLSQLTGIAITAVKIKGALHEYSSLPGVRETVLDILLNLKEIVLKKKNILSEIHFESLKEELFLRKSSFFLKPKRSLGGQKYINSVDLYGPSQIGYIRARGPGIVKASDLLLPPSIQCVDPDQYIGTLSDDGVLFATFHINKGTNYLIQKKLHIEKDVEQGQNNFLLPHSFNPKIVLTKGDVESETLKKPSVTKTPLKMLIPHRLGGGTKASLSLSADLVWLKFLRANKLNIIKKKKRIPEIEQGLNKGFASSFIFARRVTFTSFTSAFPEGKVPQGKVKSKKLSKKKDILLLKKSQAGMNEKTQIKQLKNAISNATPIIDQIVPPQLKKRQLLLKKIKEVSVGSLASMGALAKNFNSTSLRMWNKGTVKVPSGKLDRSLFYSVSKNLAKNIQKRFKPILHPCYNSVSKSPIFFNKGFYSNGISNLLEIDALFMPVTKVNYIIESNEQSNDLNIKKGSSFKLVSPTFRCQKATFSTSVNSALSISTFPKRKVMQGKVFSEKVKVNEEKPKITQTKFVHRDEINEEKEDINSITIKDGNSFSLDKQPLYWKNFQNNKNLMPNKNFTKVDSTLINFITEADTLIKNNRLQPIFKENLILEIWTNGSIHPRKALYQSLKKISCVFLKLQKIKIIGSMFKSEKSYKNLINKTLQKIN